MSNQAQYASIPKTGLVTISTANTNRDGTGTLGVVLTATATSASGTRIDKIVTQATGTTTAGAVRYYITQGRIGPAVSSMTSSGTTVTVTTSAAHNLTTGDLITMQGAYPFDYNVTNTAITVTSITAFTYSASTSAVVTTATTVGAYSTTPAVPVTRLWREVQVTALVAAVSPYVAPFSNVMASTLVGDQGYLPLILQPGYSLRASTNNAETFTCIAADSGDLA